MMNNNIDNNIMLPMFNAMNNMIKLNENPFLNNSNVINIFFKKGALTTIINCKQNEKISDVINRYMMKSSDTGINNRYLFYYLLSPTFDSYANSNENSKGVAYPAINDKALYSAIIALPPIAEQNRIVAKLEELLPFCDQLRNKQN